MTDDLSDDDMAALRECVEILSREPDRDEQLKSMFKDRPWLVVARFAAYCVQYDALRLKPWENPPCSWCGDDAAAQRLLDKMLAAGVSRFHPNPLAALEAAQAKKRKR